MRNMRLISVTAFAAIVVLAISWSAFAMNGSDDSSAPDIKAAVDLLESELITRGDIVGIGYSEDTINVYLMNQEAGDGVPDEYMGYPIRKIVTGEISIRD